MELLSSTALQLKPSLSRLHISIFSTSVLPSNPLHLKKKFTHFEKLSFSCRQIVPRQSPTRRNPSQLVVSASAVSLNTGKDRLPADIEVTETEEPSSRVRLTVTVPPVVCEDCYKRVLAELMKAAKVPGFRPGKNVPESILVGYVGKQNVHRATIESILKRTLPHAMTSVTERALKDSVRIVTKFSEMEEAYSPLNSLRYDVVVDVVPEVKWIPENGYKNLSIVVEIDNDIDAQKAYEEELKRRHKALGSLRIVIDRGLQVGDVVVIDISASTIEQDESNAQKIPSAETKGFHFDTEEADKLVPGFLDSIIGIQQGETKSFPITFPKSWKQENLCGVQAQFTVECKELFYRDLPELDDSLADRLLPGCSTLDQVKESLLQRCKEVEQTAKEQATDNAILDQLCKELGPQCDYALLRNIDQNNLPNLYWYTWHCYAYWQWDLSIDCPNPPHLQVYQMIEVDIPQYLFEEQGRQLYGSKLLQIQATMKLEEQQLASLSSPKAVNEYLQNQRENITNVIKQNLAVGDVFKRENLQFSTEELVKEVENSIAEFKRHKQEYDEERVREQVQEILEGAKVLEWLREHAEIRYVTR